MQPNITVTGHHVEVTPPLRTYVEEKFKKIHTRFDNMTSAHFTLTMGSKKFQQKAEAQVNLARGELHASAESENMYAAIDMLIDKLTRQVVKHKEKLNGHGNGDHAV